MQRKTTNFLTYPEQSKRLQDSMTRKDYWVGDSNGDVVGFFSTLDEATKYAKSIKGSKVLTMTRNGLDDEYNLVSGLRYADLDPTMHDGDGDY